MKRLSRTLTIILLPIAHAFGFLYTWAVLGSTTLFSVGSTTNSPVAALLAASLATTAIATTPLALLAGLLGGRRLMVPSVAMFMACWTGLSLLFGKPNYPNLLAELGSIGVFGSMLYLVGARVLHGRAAA
jgi:hypothetical protein